MRLPIYRRNYPAIFGILVLCFSHSGCVKLTVVDSTHSPVFASMVGAEFELVEEFMAIGTKWDSRSVAFDSILVAPQERRSFTSRYVDLGRVPAGSRFKLVGVETRWRFSPSNQYVIAFTNHTIPQSANLPTTIPDYMVSFPAYVKAKIPSEAPSLNERYFRPLGRTSK